MGRIFDIDGKKVTLDGAGRNHGPWKKITETIRDTCREDSSCSLPGVITIGDSVKRAYPGLLGRFNDVEQIVSNSSFVTSGHDDGVTYFVGCVLQDERIILWYQVNDVSEEAKFYVPMNDDTPDV